MKRKISSLVALSMLLATIVVPNFASANNPDFTDYAPVTMPENMMSEPNKGDVFGNINVSDASVTKGYNRDSAWSGTYGAYEGYFIEAVSETPENPAYYSKLAGVVTTNGAGGLINKNLTPGTAYVLSFLVRNAGTTDSANINFGLGNVDTWASCVYPTENGEAGYTVDSKTDWTKVAGTIVAPSRVPYLSIGFPKGTPAGTKVEMNLSYLPEDAIYFAEEVAYELNATADKTELEAGDTVTASAEVLNQVGTKGSLSQEFDWYVVDEARTAVIDGFDVAVSGNTAEITVGNAVADGNYVIVAVYDENMAKGIPVAVSGGTSGEEPGGNPDDDTEEDDSLPPENFNDTTATKPENMMDRPTSGEVFGNVNSSTVEKKFSDSAWNTEYNTYNGYRITALSQTSNTGAYANVSGITTTNSAGGLKGDTLVAGKAYVVSFLGKNIGTTDSFKINMGLTNADGSWLPTYTLEKGEEGYTVSNKADWTKIAGTFFAPCATPFLSIGFMNGEAQGSSMEFNLAYLPEDAIYFAEEVAYELNVVADKTKLNYGETVTVSAELLNQVGTTGSLSQEFDWYIVNEDRTEQVSGFAVSESGNTAEITVGNEVEVGNYVVVAVAENNAVIRGVSLKVEAEDSGDDPEDEPDDDFSEDEGDYSDKTPDIPANMMNNPHKGEVFGNANAIDTVTKKANDKSELWNTTYESYSGYLIEAIDVARSQGAAYANVAGVTMAYNVNNSGMHNKALVPGKAYVLSFLGRNVGTTDSFNVNFGLTNTSNWTSVYPVEYGSEGYTVADKEEWTKVAGTIVAPQANPFLSIGFVDGTEKGAKMEFNLCYLPNDAIYFAEEIPYDMEVTADIDGVLDNGSQVIFETKVTNQIGTAGTLTQDANYYVVNAERTKKVASFTFTADGCKKVMNIGNNVEPGTYYVIAENIDNPEFKKGIEITTQRAYQADFVPEDSAQVGVPHDIAVTAQNQQSSYSFLDTDVISASIYDIDDNELSGYEFEWKAYRENRRDEEENIILTPSDDTKTAEMSFTSAIENGTYYIMARKLAPSLMSAEDSAQMQRAIRIDVNNTSAYAQISNEINGASATDIEAKLDTYVEYADMSDDIYALVDKATFAQVMEKTEFTSENVKDTMLSAAIVSLYVNNPQNVTLNDSTDLSFEYADELGFAKMYDSGVTLMDLYADTLSQTQRSAVMTIVNAMGVVSPKTFVEKLCETIILEGVKKSNGTLGTGYVLDYIKEANLSAANINKGKLTSSNANLYTSSIAGKVLTKAELEAILATDMNGGANGGSGSSGGGGGSAGGSGGGGAGGSTGATSGSGSSEPTIKPTAGGTADKSAFNDVSDNHWAFKQIEFLRKQNIISGKNENSFCPNDYLKREEMTRILVSAFKLVGTENATNFSDVEKGAWYENSIRTASSNGIVMGISDTTFGVGENITRQDLCVMIARAIGKDGVKGADLVFNDKDEIASYAQDAVSYLNMMCVINGYEDNTFRPTALCTRAEAAKIIGDILNYEIKEVE